MENIDVIKFSDELNKIRENFDQKFTEMDSKLINIRNDFNQNIIEIDVKFKNIHEEIEETRIKINNDKIKINDDLIKLNKQINSLQISIDKSNKNISTDDLDNRLSILEFKLETINKMSQFLIRESVLKEFIHILEQTKYYLLYKYNLDNKMKFRNIIEYLAVKYIKLDQQIITLYNKTDLDILNYKHSLKEVTYALKKINPDEYLWKPKIVTEKEVIMKNIFKFREMYVDKKVEKYTDNIMDLIAYIKIIEHLINLNML